MLLNFILLSYIIQNIFPYIIFPLNEFKTNIDLIKDPIEAIKEISKTELYITLEIGSKRAKIKVALSQQRSELFISGKDIISHKYDESLSKSYLCPNNYTKELYYGLYKEVALSKENFYIQNDNNEIQLIEQLNFLLGKKNMYKDNKYEGIIGLRYIYFNGLKDFNFIGNLKLKKIINSYYWFLNFDNFEKEEGKMFIGTLPHLIDNKFKENNFKEVPGTKSGFWGFDFDQIFYGNSNDLKKSYHGYIHFDVKTFLGPNELMEILDEEFFNKYIKEKICFKEVYGFEKNIFYYCKNVKEFHISEFKEIKFKINQLEKYFVFNYKDLFYYKDDLIYFLILFQEININSFKIGHIFLKKYNLVFNQDSKTIGYYVDKININKTVIEDFVDNKNKINITLTNILLILILLSIIFLSILVYRKGINRKIRASELEEQFQYAAKEDNSNKKTDK